MNIMIPRALSKLRRFAHDTRSRFTVCGKSSEQGHARSEGSANGGGNLHRREFLLSNLVGASYLRILPLKIPASQAHIEIDCGNTTGKVNQLIFGQFIEHEHKTIQGGIWSEVLRNRKFGQGDADRDGIGDEWVAQEVVADHYWELEHGKARTHRYFLDEKDYFGGGAQAIEVWNANGEPAIWQIGFELSSGRYQFSAYLKCSGAGRVSVVLDRRGRPVCGKAEFTDVSSEWRKFTSEFTVPVDISDARLRIGVKGYGTFWIGAVSLMPAENVGGVRRDVIEALKPLKIPIMRYPGGCFADEFHWKNAIGPRDKRPTTWSDVWQEWDPNDFGIDEFMDFARELGSEPHITVNYASGTPEEAAEWVEYCNATGNTSWASRRVQYGHPEPYGVKFWAVGNEPAESCRSRYTGGTDIHEYAARFLQFKEAMQKVDHSIVLMAGGTPPGPDSWNRELLGLLGKQFDFLAMSLYTGKSGKVLQICDLESYYRQVVAEPVQFEQTLNSVIKRIGDRLPQHQPILAITEYNSWWMPETGDPHYHLCNALYLAGVYHALLRHTSQVAIAEWNTTVNVQGMISVNPIGVKLPPPYFAALLYRNHIGNMVLESSTHTPSVHFNSSLAALDVTATISQDGRTVFVSVINRESESGIKTAVHLQHWKMAEGAAARVFEVNGRNRDATNYYGKPLEVCLTEKSVSLSNGSFYYRFPPHSVTVLACPGEVVAADDLL
jgi:alpha-L-arabinofuranosidase